MCIKHLLLPLECTLAVSHMETDRFLPSVASVAELLREKGSGNFPRRLCVISPKREVINVNT